MNSPQYTWHKIAESILELQAGENRICVADINGKKICLGEYQQQWFGFAYKCPHASGIMADGYIDALGNIVCPVHRFKFSLRNGRNTSGEGYFLKTYPVELRKDGVYVGM
jgi:3-phenylpropionate/trans-cinnamate dioxygenase ferredoxin subunit